ncbi:MAG: hypothetical protein ABR526_04260 [Chthoniobacterales bacterium]
MVTAGIGVVVLAGWSLQIPPLRRFVPGWVSMNPVTACCLLAAGVALALLRSPDAARPRELLGQLLAAIVMPITSSSRFSLRRMIVRCAHGHASET